LFQRWTHFKYNTEKLIEVCLLSSFKNQVCANNTNVGQDDEELFHIVFDMGFSNCLTYCLTYFVSSPPLHGYRGNIKTAGGSIPITGFVYF
jgi:hypothetical protein